MTQRPDSPLVKVRFQVVRRGSATDYRPGWLVVLGIIAVSVVFLIAAAILLTSALALMFIVIALAMAAAFHLVYVPHLSRRIGLGAWTMGLILLAALGALGYFVAKTTGVLLASVIWLAIFAGPRMLLVAASRRIGQHRSGS